MERRKLGKSDIEIAPVMFGGNVLGWSLPEPEAFRVLDAFVDAGFNAIDTADVYGHWDPAVGWGASEKVLGRWFAANPDKRDKVVLATKLGMKEEEGKEGLGAARMVECVEASLQRLQTDRIDLYQAHRDDPNTPLEETLEAFSKLVAAGKVRIIGASNYSAERLALALDLSEKNGWPRYETLQPLHNLYARSQFEDALQPLCVERQVSVVPYFALAQGFLSGKYRTEADFGKSEHRGYRMKQFFNPRGFRILEALDKVAASHDCTVAQAALAWGMAQPAVAAPIVSATNLDQLADILGSAEVKLTAEDKALLDAASAKEPEAA